MMESKRRVFEAYYGIDLSAIVASSASGTKNELVFDQPDLPDLMEWRLLLLGRDGRGTNAIYHAEWFPITSLTEVGARAWVGDRRHDVADHAGRADRRRRWAPRSAPSGPALL
jgi:hypothetical protein